MNDKFSSETDGLFSRKQLIFAILAFFFLSVVILPIFEHEIEGYLKEKIPGIEGAYPKLLTLLLVAVLSSILLLVRHQTALARQAGRTLKKLEEDLPNIVKEQISTVLPEIGRGLLRETLVESILVDSVGGAHHHKSTFGFLRALQQVDLRLAPGIAVVAEEHVEGLQNALRALQHETEDFSIRGDYQVKISEAFTKECSKVIFFDPKPSVWSTNFTEYVRGLSKKSCEKRQYIVCSQEEYNLPKQERAQYIRKMQELSFDVFLVSISAFEEAGINSSKWRLEIYNNEIVFKIPSMSSFVEAPRENLNVTLRTVDDDGEAKTILEILRKHGKRKTK